MLLELVNEGWPLAIEALREQACEAEKLKLRCERLGYRESERLVYLEWARKDPLHVWMYSKATRSSTYLKNPEEELSAEEYEYLLYGKGVKGVGNYEKIKILNEGISKGCTTCSIQLYNRFFLKILSDIDKEVTISKYNVKKLKELAGITKELLYLGGDYNSYLQLKLVSFSELDEDYKIKYSKVYDMYNVPTFTENEMLKFVEIYAEKGSANFFLN
ncbi:hypothetical protein VIBNISFn118_2040001 [Vibrio nigripulchritudo SFn118]|nr:hypothetical protein VIBNISFn118_2040001 [Vibrio nigripulchritudo SFn118]